MMWVKKTLYKKWVKNKDPGYSEMSVQDLHFINSAKWFFNGAKSAPYA